jgi:hypothetical protein
MPQLIFLMSVVKKVADEGAGSASRPALAETQRWPR